MADYDPAGLPDMSEEPQQANGEYLYNPNGAAAADDDDDYDPSFDTGSNEELAQQPQSTETHAAPSEPAKPKTMGGFVMEESDDDDEEDEEHAVPPPSQLNGTEGTQNGLGAVGVSEAADERMADVHVASELTQDSAAQLAANNSLNGSASSSTSTDSATLSATTAPVDASSSLAVSTPAQAPVAGEGKNTAVSPAAAGAASVTATPAPAVNGISAPPATTTAVPATPTQVMQRLPHDKVGRLEDRIKDDPKSDTDAWSELIQHYRDKDQLDNARRVFERMLEVWPTSPRVYLQYLDLEYPLFERQKIDVLFSTSLPACPSLPLWSQYLSYLRRVFPLNLDSDGNNRKIITSGFEAVLDAVGLDPASGELWREYIDFIKGGPGSIIGSGWQDLQKVDQLRQAYQRAVKQPTTEVVKIWKEYDGFEMSVNKANGRKMLQEMSPHYMTARTAARQIEQITDGLLRGEAILATLPPLEGCEGDDQFAVQVQKWRSWIAWEISDPLVFKDEDMAAYRKRVLFAYKQATIALRFWPQIWYEASQFCFEALPPTEELSQQGEQFVDEGLKANPESVLLTLKKADRVEEGLQVNGVADEVAITNGEKLEGVFEPCLKALYELVKKITERREKSIREVREYFASLPPEEGVQQTNADDDDEADARADADDVAQAVNRPKNQAEQLQERITAIQAVVKDQIETLKRTISYIWIAKMRAFRRIQGQGAPGKPKKGFRGVFAEARPRGQLSADVYVASALMEWHCYKDASALKIFERGLKLFPTDEGFALEYIRHLISVNDLTNARVVFETTVTKILGASGTEDDKKKAKVRPLLGYMHCFESQFGDMAAVRKLEGRMKELYPLEPESVRFGNRFEMGSFDGMGVQLILSERQARPKTISSQQPMAGMPPMAGPFPTIEAPGMGTPDGSLRLGPNGPYMASPKRPLDDDTDQDTPRKFMRAESPLKGAAGRRVQGHTTTSSMSGGTLTTNIGGGGSGFMTKNYVPPTSPAYQGPGAPGGAGGPAQLGLPPGVMHFLSILPNARRYDSVTFDANRVVEFFGRLDMESHRQRVEAQDRTFQVSGYGLTR